MPSGMAPTVSGKELRKIGESLGRFADTRATAKEPRDRVVVQAAAGTVKVVAGAPFGTIIATVHATTQQWRAVISARELLTTLKTVSTKGQYSFEDLNKGWEIGCSLGGADFLRLDKKLPKFILPPGPQEYSQGYVDLPGDTLEDMGNILTSVGDEIYGSPINVAGRIHTQDDTIQFSATNNVRYASIIVKGNYDLFGTLKGDFLEAARAIGGARMEFWTNELVTLENDSYRVVAPYKSLTTFGPLQFKPGARKPIEFRAVVDRTKFVKNLREQAKLDKDGRVNVYYADNALEIRPFEGAKAGWYARAENLLKVLTATKAKQVGIGLRIGFGQPINVRIPEWTIEIAPVELTLLKQ